ncbi:hypothetical protein [Nocardia cyriacigeorgica]|uniref:hypothetical protein n=1 Tax=Nocardia cyriacigeorgica TaxID=135487 RepID=UPI002454109B|nr:hypothetical protein [Nocardia cyriacigeorgica]
MTVYNVPSSQANKKENRFALRFKDGGKVYSVPKLGYLSGEASEFIEQAMKDNLTEVVLTRRLLRIECPQAEQEIRRLHDDQILDISRRWVSESGITPGESLGSENS